MVEPYTARKPYLDYLIDSSFEEVNRLFASLFENNADRTAHLGHVSPKVEIKDCNVKIDGRNFFDQPINDDIETYENISKIAAGQRNLRFE